MSFHQIPPTNKPRAFANVSKGECSGSPWHCLCQSTPRWPSPASCRQDPALGAVGRLCPYLLKTSWPQKPKGWLVLHRSSLSSLIYTQLDVAAGWVNSWFWNPQDFQAKVPWLWQASFSAPLPACIWCGSTSSLPGANSLCKGALSLLAGNREG